MSADIWKIKIFGELLRGGDIYLIAYQLFCDSVSQHVIPALAWSECFSRFFANMSHELKNRERIFLKISRRYRLVNVWLLILIFKTSPLFYFLKTKYRADYEKNKANADYNVLPATENPLLKQLKTAGDVLSDVSIVKVYLDDF